MKKLVMIILTWLAAVSAHSDELGDMLGNSLTSSLPPEVSGMLGGFSIWGMIWGTIFGGVGVFAFLYGKKKSNAAFIVIGIILCIYPFLIRDNRAVFIVGALLTAALYFFRNM
jgi:hypothetical protein